MHLNIYLKIDDANYMARKLIDAEDEWGLEINHQKAQVMVVGNKVQVKNINTQKDVIKIVEKHIMNKMGPGRAVIRQLHSIIWSKTF